MKLVECVPNFSEGRDRVVIDAIAAAAGSVQGVDVLDVDPGADTNRTVLTFVGAPDAVVEAAFRVFAKARELIDMRQHKGEHPRHGAVDVCPFVPVNGVSMEECAELARRLGARVGSELRIPVYLYEHAATRPERRNLATLRAGEYEALPRKLGTTEWAPDFGPNVFNEAVARTGVGTIGAREFLVAYNINLNTRDKRFALDIAFDIREKGRSVRAGNIVPDYFRGEIVRYEVGAGRLPCGQCAHVAGDVEALQGHYGEAHDFDWLAFQKVWEQPVDALEGAAVKRPGLFKACKATGWTIEDYGCAQITMNLTDTKVTPVHEVLEACRRIAAERGLVVTGSEVVGLIPFESLYAAGQFYLRRFGGPTGLPWRDVLEVAVRSMGLDDVAEFDIDKKVIGLPEEPAKCLMSLTARGFCDEVSRESPAPGGGSVSALGGALGASLASMVANLSVGKVGYEAVSAELDGLSVRAQRLKDKLVRAVDLDTEAFNGVLVALRMPKGNDDEKARRTAAIQEGYKGASRVPLESARCCLEAAEIARALMGKGIPSSITDLAVGVLMATAGVEGSVYNVRTNLPSIHDAAFREEMSRELSQLVARAKALRVEVEEFLQARF
ncbi:MAG: glutamate formimidoyltransferase [Deltaproteobacteria bacterium CG2_30_63_29]|nr:MAG: glutamate formimidoyltransferase [Deltaproteobacteria bacterium CG2_30_63_29]